MQGFKIDIIISVASLFMFPRLFLFVFTKNQKLKFRNHKIKNELISGVSIFQTERKKLSEAM